MGIHLRPKAFGTLYEVRRSRGALTAPSACSPPMKVIEGPDHAVRANIDSLGTVETENLNAVDAKKREFI